MKNKHLLFSFLAFVIAGCLMILFTSWISKQNYTSRQEKNNLLNFNNNYLSEIINNSIIGNIDFPWISEAQGDIHKHKQTQNKDNKNGKTLGLTWSEIGPDNLSGRTRAILVDKNNPNLLFIGGVSGGLWKSTTGGSSWIPVNDFADDLAIASIAQATDGSIYVGTGEGLSLCTGTANGSTAFIGKGIYKSTDGETFSILTSTIPAIDNCDTAAWVFVNKIACDPNNANRIYAATNKGLRSSDDGGTSWINPLINITDNATDVDVSNDGTVITSVGNKCYISDNGNSNTFVCQSGSSSGKLPTNISRLEMAISPSNSHYIYANTINSLGKIYNIYQSTDKGNNWIIIGPGNSTNFQPFGTQGISSNFIAVHPTNPENIFVGGDNLWEWQTGTTWTQKSLNYVDPTSSLFLHAGQNNLIFDKSNSNTMYIVSSGGISRSNDGGGSFQTLNLNYNTIQCNALSYSPMGKIMAGAQDNGTLFFDRLNPVPKQANAIKTGNGGWSAFSYINPEAYFATASYGVTARSPDAGSTFYNGNDGSSPFFSARMTPTTFDTSFAAYVTPILLWESYNDTYSSDSITFTPTPVVNENMGKGKNNQTRFDSTLSLGGQSSASIEPGTLEIVSGTLFVTDDGSGKLVGDVNIDSINSINYSTGKYKVNFSNAPASNANILASYHIKYVSGSSILIKSGNNPGEFYYTTPNTLEYGDSIKIQDIIQAKFYLGTNDGIWMTKQALKFSIRPKWYKVATLTGQSTQCMAISHDGNYIFAGTSNGLLYRISNLRAAQDSISSDVGTASSTNPYSIVETKKLTFNAAANRAITSIAVDPSDANKIVITLGNYNSSNYIYYCTNALDSMPTFTSKQGNLQKMPVYTSCIPLLSNGTVIIGTEYGIYSTDNIASSSPLWNEDNDGLAHVPVYMILQQQNLYPWVTNYGTMYAATHGRGVFECTKYTSINEPNNPATSSVNTPLSVKLYPNPVIDNATISFNLPKNGDVKIRVYDISGKVVKSIYTHFSAGSHTFTFDCSYLNRGTYIVQLISNGKSASSKFIVNR